MAADQIHDFVRRALRDQTLSPNADIFASGAVSSLFAMELVTFLEGTFAITIETEDLELDNFRTVGRMAELVARKTGVAAA
jgi:acyl carrier protein